MRRYSEQSIVFKTKDSEEVTCGVKIGILVVVVGAAADDPIPADNVDVALVIEEQVMIHDLHNVPNTFATLIGLLYCPNMDHPNCLRYTFEVVQKMFLKIGAENCTAKVQLICVFLFYSQ
uniref:Uncharacterized protein n=1 Tax=Oncorhynchus tshawytscha TaxID=74940 RepID=A0A8C8CC26_ONCTS